MLVVWGQFYTQTFTSFYKMVYNILLFCVIWSKYFLRVRGQGLKMLFEFSIYIPFKFESWYRLILFFSFWHYFVTHHIPSYHATWKSIFQTTTISPGNWTQVLNMEWFKQWILTHLAKGFRMLILRTSGNLKFVCNTC